MTTYGQIQRGPMAADNFTQIANSLFRDPRLSAKAKGIFGFISTHRTGWGVTPESIAACMTDGVSAVNSGLRQLEEFGYLVRSQERKPDGTMGPMAYWITDMPSSEPVGENHQAALTCEDTGPAGQDEHLRRSEPVVDFPHTVDPRAADRLHKKTIPQKTRGKNTPSSVPPGGEAAGRPQADQGGGGGDAPQRQEQSHAAAVFVDALPYRGPLPGPKARAHLVERAAAAMAAGWTEHDLRTQLTADTSNAKSMAAVFRYRLDPENLPAPPDRTSPAVLPGPRVVVNDTAGTRRECTGQDGMCGRPLTDTETGLCRRCAQDTMDQSAEPAARLMHA